MQTTLAFAPTPEDLTDFVFDSPVLFQPPVAPLADPDDEEANRANPDAPLPVVQGAGRSG